MNETEKFLKKKNAVVVQGLVDVCRQTGVEVPVQI
jgi:hypothetical protein